MSRRVGTAGNGAEQRPVDRPAVAQVGSRGRRPAGFFSVVSYRLFSTDRILGALNLFGKDRSAFSSDDVHDGMALAAHVGVALAGALEVENLEKALGGRTVIGQATGILMERFDLAPERAFGLLARISQSKHLKLRQVAEQIVLTRTVPKT